MIFNGRADAPTAVATATPENAPLLPASRATTRAVRRANVSRTKTEAKAGKRASFRDRPKGGRDGRPDGGASHRQYASSAPPRERDRPVDPNSPFAKLAALKEQLTANRKDQR